MDNVYSLKVEKCKIDFTYSFILTYNKIFPSKEEYQKLFQGTGNPDERKGLSSYLALDLTTGYKRYDPIIGIVDEQQITIIPLVRYFHNGCSVTLEVIAEAKSKQFLSDQFVYELQHLTNIEGHKSAVKKIRLPCGESPSDLTLSETTTIYNIFKEIIDNVTDKDNDIEIFGREVLNEATEEVQTPWVVTMLELGEGDALHSFCSSFSDLPLKDRYNKKIEAIHNYENIIAPILYRAPDDNLHWDSEPTYNFKPNALDDHLHNLYFLSKLFIQMSRRSIILITDNLNDRPSSYVIPTLLDIVEMTHTRWQNLIIQNVLLDRSIKILSDNKKKPKEELSLLISTINNVSQCLEDPLIYNVSGNILREIGLELRKTFRIEELTSLLLNKISLLEKVDEYSDQRDLYS